MKKVVVGLLAMSVALALLQMVVTALVVALATLLVFSFIARPQQTLVFIVTLLLFGLASARPTAFIVMLGIVALTVVIVDALRKSRHRLLLRDGREHRSQGPARLDRDLLG